MIKQIIKNDKRLCFIQKLIFLSLNKDQKIIYKKIDDFLKKYSKFNNLRSKEIYSRYIDFINQYINDCKNFEKKKKYPYELAKIKTIPRINYEISLILSCLLTTHRFSIIENICKVNNLRKTLFIGAGTGIEVFIIRKKLNIFKVYDPESSEFLSKISGNERLEKKEFNLRYSDYNTIFLIEFLEHLKNPYNFLKNIYSNMKNGSKIICTTAKNIPQFDHLYNFKSQINFENKIKKIGFKIIFKKIILHNLDLQNIKSDNVFYIIKK